MQLIIKKRSQTLSSWVGSGDEARCDRYNYLSCGPIFFYQDEHVWIIYKTKLVLPLSDLTSWVERARRWLSLLTAVYERWLESMLPFTEEASCSWALNAIRPSNSLAFLGWHPDFAAHPRRIASHPHLARLCERWAKRRSFPLIQSATGSWRRGNTVQQKLWREKTWGKYNFRGESSCGLLAFVAPRMPHPQISWGEISRRATKPQICKS